jgi:predicted component of type VI protein secretion system
MRLYLIKILSVCTVCVLLAGCGSSKPKITEPVGKVQLGMTVTEVSHVLGDGAVVEPAQSDGAHTMEVREYAASNGRVYVVRFIDGLVRRWEIQSR